ncbi:MAG: UDP-2,3-diacylglucosamine diphosphatase [Bacteroidota bacterium]
MAIYFASDFHLGVDARVSSEERERQIVRWLKQSAQDADAFYLVGDLFEFWFEWSRVVPRGYVRFFGALSEIADSGIPIYVFTGNHDMWMRDYLIDQVGVQEIYRKPQRIQLQGREILLAHGDGLGPGDKGYKRLKKVINAPWASWFYARLHPNMAMKLAYFFSGKSRSAQPPEVDFLGPEKEWLVAYSERKLVQEPEIDYCIFGHRHLPIDYTLSNGKSRYLNLGEWLHYNSYVRMEKGEAELLFFEREGMKAANLL